MANARQFLAARTAAWAKSGGPAPEPVLEGISFYLEGVPAGTTLLGTTGYVDSTANPVVVDWGDGTKDTIAYATTRMPIPAHTYESAGDYIINITGEDVTEIGSSRTSYPIFTETKRADFPFLKKFTISDSYAVKLGSGSITGYIFRLCSGLEEVYLGSITSLGASCFRDCTSLTSVTIPSSVTSIGTNCFNGCTSLTSVTIPSSVTSIGVSCFNGCTSLTSVTIPSSVTSIGDSCFRDCTSLTSVTIPSSVTSIGASCFNGCTARIDLFGTTGRDVNASADALFGNCEVHFYRETLVSSTCYKITGQFKAIIENSVTSIGDSCFQDCTSLTSVTIPSSVTSIGAFCFQDCTSLTSVTIPSSVTSIGGSCFNGCTSLTSVTIPSSVTSIGGSCFNGCTARIDLFGTTGRGVNASADDLFGNCEVHFYGNTIKSFTCHKITGQFKPVIENGVTSIGMYCFKGCTGLTSVTIPDSVTSIGAVCFADCTGLTSIISLSVTPPRAIDNSFDNIDKSIPVYVPDESVSVYRATSVWNAFTNIQSIPE